jgi:hypothetical protein
MTEGVVIDGALDGSGTRLQGRLLRGFRGRGASGSPDDGIACPMVAKSVRRG